MKMTRKAINIVDIKELIDFSVNIDSLTSDDLVNIINQCGDYLNIISPKNYAKINK